MSFIPSRHHLIVIYKTAFYSFYLPVALAMHVCNIPESYPGPTPGAAEQRPYDIALSILLPLGKYFQVQDDFLDYYADPEALGKIGTDIIDNKCSWCINTALKIATPEQRAVLYENYGQKDSEKEAKVKEAYKEMGIDKIYKEYEESVVAEIRAMIEKIPESQPGAPGLQREVFTSFLEKIYKRSK
jgi:farnesyl diphosphate synthase